MQQPPHVLHHRVDAEVVSRVLQDGTLDDVGELIAEGVGVLHVVGEEGEPGALERGAHLRPLPSVRIGDQEAAVGRRELLAEELRRSEIEDAEPPVLHDDEIPRMRIGMDAPGGEERSPDGEGEKPPDAVALFLPGVRLDRFEQGGSAEPGERQDLARSAVGDRLGHC